MSGDRRATARATTRACALKIVHLDGKWDKEAVWLRTN